MFRLERGATGFQYARDPELPEISVRRFRGACYEAARVTDGTVERIVESTYPDNYHSAVIGGSAERFAVLCNAIYPWIAFVEEGTGNWADPGTFIDPPACATTFAETGFVVMSRQLLESPLSLVDTAALGKSERTQIRSWKSENVGRTVFNSWD